ncbi:Glycosyl transferase family 2 [Cognatishimia maritima]|uniref:Glycosyl transferase family 2 n=1 Tax=Cognatishimia maritima TaxID=870908 RepID=A0A1M5P6Z8_9RHOB|nr:Glycosyl transferase family 2 [Cognatishimia maritima]
MLWRCIRARRQLSLISQKPVPNAGVLVFSVLRNEIARLPFFLEFYRNLGSAHFLFVDNGSDDGTAEYLAGQPDCSLWSTPASYRDARFGLDWLNWLQIRFGHGRWCLMVDADELLVFDGDDACTLPQLTESLEQIGQGGFGALMLDLYPQAALGTDTYKQGQDPREVLTHFDPGPFRQSRQEPRGNLWVQGGARERVFFADAPERSPTLNKIPLIKWRRSFAWTNSCHALLPRRLNFLYDGPGGGTPSGALLHTKFLPEIVEKAQQERQRRQHFHTPEDFDDYYRQIEEAPVLFSGASRRYDGPTQLAELGLISKRDWMVSKK